MKKTPIDKHEAEERLALLFRETQLGVELDEFMEELIPPDNPWWGDQSATDAEKVLPQAAAADDSKRNRLSSFINRKADWTHLANRYFELGDSSVGSTMKAAAATKSVVGKASVNHITWRQDKLLLTLSIKKTKPFTMTLHIDEGPDVEINQMKWIDEGSISDNSQCPPVLCPFDVQRTSSERTFKVDATPAEVARRLSAIKAAEKMDMTDALLLLPFVEWD